MTLKHFSFGWTYAPHREWSSEQLAAMDEFAQTLDQRFTAISKEADRVRADPYFTPAGREKQLRELSAQAEVSLLEPFGKVGPQLAKQIGELEEAMRAKGPTQQSTAEVIARAAGQMVTSIMAWEIRDHVRTLDRLERDVFYKTAVHAGDVEAAEALESAPRSMPLVSREVVDELFDKRQEQRYPKQWKEFRALKLLHAEMESGLKAAFRDLRAHGIAVDTFDPLARLLEKHAA